MSIDLKAILGDTSSVVMTPAEMAQISLRKKAMRHEAEQGELNRQTRTLSALSDTLANVDTLAEQQAYEDTLRTLGPEIHNDSVKALYTMVSSSVGDNRSKMQEYDSLIRKFNTFEGFTRDKYIEPKEGEVGTDAKDLWSEINEYKKIAGQLGSQHMLKFLSPEMQAKLHTQTEHYAVVAEALITEGILRPDEWDVIESGSLKAFTQMQTSNIETIDNQYTQNNKMIAALKKYEQDLQDPTKSFEKILSSLEVNNDTKHLAEGLTMPNSGALQLAVMQERVGYENLNDTLNEKYKIWKGVPKFYKKQQIQPGDVSKEDQVKALGLEWVSASNQWRDSSGDMFSWDDTNKHFVPGEKAKPATVEEETSFTEGIDWKTLGEWGITAGAFYAAPTVIDKFPNVVSAGKVFLEQTASAAKYLKSEFKLSPSQISELYNDKFLQKELARLDELKKYKPKAGVGRDPKKEVKRVYKGIMNYFARKYKIDPEDVGRLIKHQDKWYAPKLRTKFIDKTGRKFGKKYGTRFFTGQMVNDLLNIETENAFGQLALDFGTGAIAGKSMKKFSRTKLMKEILKPKTIEALTPILKKVAPKLLAKLTAGAFATLVPEGISTAFGLGMIGVSVYDLYALAKQHPRIREILKLDIPE